MISCKLVKGDHNFNSELIFNIENGRYENLSHLHASDLEVSLNHKKMNNLNKRSHDDIGYHVEIGIDDISYMKHLLYFIRKRHEYLNQIIARTNISLLPYTSGKYHVYGSSHDLYLFAIDDENEFNSFLNLIKACKYFDMLIDLDKKIKYPMILGMEKDLKDDNSDKLSIICMSSGNAQFSTKSISLDLLITMEREIMDDLRSIVYDNMSSNV